MNYAQEQTVGCTEDVQAISVRKPHNRFCAWKNYDSVDRNTTWLPFGSNLSVQVRLEEDGSVFLSTQEEHISTLRIATITIEQLHALIRGVTANA